MRVAVVGAEGQLGAELCRQFGAEAAALDLPGLDLTDRGQVSRQLQPIRPQVIINAAAFTRVDVAEVQGDRCRAVNVGGVEHLVEVCRQLDCMLVQISTDYVFGGGADRRVPYREIDEPAPQGVYARSKLDAERLAASWSKHLIVRTCGLYGRPAPQAAGNFVNTMLRVAGQGRPLRVVDDQLCTPSYVPHVTRAVRFLVDGGLLGLYHVVNAGQTTWYGMAAEILRLARLDVPLEPITSAQYAAPAPRPAYSVLDTSKYDSLPSRPPMPPWQDALAEYLAARIHRQTT